MGKWILCIGFGVGGLATADASIQKSFESSYVQLQKQIEALKQQGGKVSTQAEKEMNQLLVQMNHEHSEIKRALELKNQQVAQKVAAAKKTFGEDWPGRVQRALGEFSEGLERAWDQLQGAQ